MTDKKTRLVYSTDPALNQKCPQCKENSTECTCRAETPVLPGQLTAVLRIEKAGRGGKTVTVIAQLPNTESFLKELCTELKKKCGTGGTYNLGDTSGTIELQGEKRELLRTLLPKKGLRVKG